MFYRSVFFAALLLLACRSASGAIANYYDYLGDVVVNGNTATWTFDFRDLALDDPYTDVNYARLSIGARGVDGHPDPVQVESDIDLGFLNPGSTSFTSFYLPSLPPGYSGRFEYLDDGLLEVSVTANEWSTVQVWKEFTYRRFVRYQDVYGWRYINGVRRYVVIRRVPIYETVTEHRLVTEIRDESLYLTSSNLQINYTERQPPPSVPEPSTIAIWSLLGFVGVGGAAVRKRRKAA